MKLQDKYNRATISVVIFVLFLAGIGYYVLIHRALIAQLDEALRVEEQEIHHHVTNTGSLPAESEFRDQKITFKKSAIASDRKFFSTRTYNAKEKETEIIRRLIFPIRVGNETYTAIVTKSQREAEDLLLLILMITAFVILLLFLFLFITNRILLKRLWKPFQGTLSSIKEFDLSRPSNKKLPHTDISEFSALNAAWDQVTKKMTADFESLKSFADNASHEMQTPLAIINSKLDLLIQSQDLKGENIQHVQSMYDAINKLTRLNQTLLLLTKIENAQYTEKEEVKMHEHIRVRIESLEELIQSKQLQLHLQLDKSIACIHPHLAEMLISNLILNAIRHNRAGGSISIKSNSNGFHISNTGTMQALDPGTIFDRFRKDTQSGGTGLGLAIVKQICDTHNYQIQYAFRMDVHAFEVKYNPGSL